MILIVYELSLNMDFKNNKSKTRQYKRKKILCSVTSQDSDELSNKERFDIEPLDMKLN